MCVLCLFGTVNIVFSSWLHLTSRTCQFVHFIWFGRWKAFLNILPTASLKFDVTSEYKKKIYLKIWKNFIIRLHIMVASLSLPNVVLLATFLNIFKRILFQYTNFWIFFCKGNFSVEKSLKYYPKLLHKIRITTSATIVLFCL